MNGKDLVERLQRDELVAEHFGGLFCSDEIQDLAPRKVYVCNTATKNEDYGHFLLYHTMKPNGTVELLCSAATNYKEYPCLYKKLINYAKNTKIYTFPKRMQANYSTSCGNYVSFYSFMACRHIYGPEMYSRFFERYIRQGKIFKCEILCAMVVENVFHCELGLTQDLILDLDFIENQKKYYDREKSKKHDNNNNNNDSSKNKS